MTYYKEFKDIPLYYQDAVKKLLDAGAIAGTGKGLELSEDLCRAFTILDKAGLLKLCHTRARLCAVLSFLRSSIVFRLSGVL